MNSEELNIANRDLRELCEQYDQAAREIAKWEGIRRELHAEVIAARNKRDEAQRRQELAQQV